jgi:hypothetical protein
MPVRISSLPQLRSDQLNRSRRTHDRHISDNRRGLRRKIFVHSGAISDNSAMLPRIDQRKISIDLFRLTHHRFGSAMRTSFQVTDNKKA